MAIFDTRTKSDSADVLNEFADNESVKVEWIAKPNEYNLSQTT